MSAYHPEIKKIVLAALLHDVGKFGQRAGGGIFYFVTMIGDFVKISSRAKSQSSQR